MSANKHRGHNHSSSDSQDGQGSTLTTAEGKLYLFVAIDGASKFAVVELVNEKICGPPPRSLKHLSRPVPYRIHTVLTDNGIQFADLPKNRQGPTALFRGHPFDRLCLLHGIESPADQAQPSLD